MNIKKVLELKNNFSNKYIKILIYFLIAMFLMTFVSRMSKSLTVPVVKTTNINSANINNALKASGTLKGNESTNVNNIEGCEVSDIYVSVGKEVSKDEVLFKIKIDSVNQKISDINNQINEKNKALNRAYEDYNHAKSVEEKKITDAKSAMDRSTKGTPEYESLKAAYNDALNNKDYNIISYKRAIEDLQNNSTLQSLNNSLNIYNQIIQDEGNIKSPCKGTISDISISKNEIGQSPYAMTITDTSKGVRFVGKISKIEGEKIKKGMNAKLNDGDNKFTIDSVSEDVKDAEMMDVVALLDKDMPPDTKIGQNVTISVILSSQNYDTCIPIEAVRSDGDKDFILILAKEDSYLGEIYKAEKVNVQILDKDAINAAIDRSSGINNEDKIILRSNKNVFEKDEVREDSE